MTNKTIRLAAYCRVSTKKEGQLDSLMHQKEFFEQYAAREGMELAAVYADEGVSGRQLRRREQFMRMLSDAACGVFDLVAVKDISRFARNTVDCLQAIRALKKQGIAVRFLSSGQESLGDSEFILTVYASLAQEESANLSKRVKFGKELNAKKGRVPPMLYGYDRLDLFTLSICSAEAEAVRFMFARYLDGWGAARIAQELNRMGTPTKLGKQWESRGVRRCLCNPVYCGTLVNHRSTVVDYLDGTVKPLPQSEWFSHERPDWAIVPRTWFDAVQQEMARRKKIAASGGQWNQSRRATLPLSGLIVCGTCGGIFSPRTRGRQRYWMCWHHDRNKNTCTNAVSIPETIAFDLLEHCLHDLAPVQPSWIRTLTHAQLTRLLSRIEVEQDRTVRIFWRKENDCSDCCGTNRNT